MLHLDCFWGAYFVTDFAPCTGIGDTGSFRKDAFCAAENETYKWGHDWIEIAFVGVAIFDVGDYFFGSFALALDLFGDDIFWWKFEHMDEIFDAADFGA